MTNPEARRILREWRETHSNLYPCRDSDDTCIHSVWLDGLYGGPCGRPAQWVVDYSLRVKSLGARPHCEDHAVSVIWKWTQFERGEVPA